MNEKRSDVVFFNIKISFLFKAASVLLSFFQVPLTVHYLSELEYGIWGALFSVLSWISCLDFGIAQGMRNKLTIAVSRERWQEAKVYIATGLAAVAALGTVLFGIFFLLFSWIDIHSFYNTEAISDSVLYEVSVATLLFVSLTFVLSIINPILYSFQRAAMTGAVALVQAALMLLGVLWLTFRGEHGLLYFVYSYGFAAIVSRGAFLLHFFAVHGSLLPNWSSVRLYALRSISSLGVRFFMIQLAGIVFYAAPNFFIASFLGPEHIRTYDIVSKIYNTLVLLFSLFMQPMWGAFTDAYVKGDIAWIKKALLKIHRCLAATMALALAVTLLLPTLISLWIHEVLHPTQLLVWGMTAYVFLAAWGGIWAIFLNSIGKINLELCVNMIAAAVLVPLAYGLMKQIGTAGMIWAIDIGLAITAFPQWIQARKILKKMTAGNE